MNACRVDEPAGSAPRPGAPFAVCGDLNSSPIKHGKSWEFYSRDIKGNPVKLYVDTPWHAPQPCGEPLDLATTDADIERLTGDLRRPRPGSRPFAGWRSERLAVRQVQ